MCALPISGGVGLAKVAHRPVIDEVGALVGPELDIYRAVDPVNPGHECLLETVVEGEPREFELQGLTGPAEVHELDVVTRLGCAVGFREPEVALAAHESGAAFDHAVGK